MLRERVITAGIFGIVVITCIFISWWTAAGLFFVIGYLGLKEWFSMFQKKMESYVSRILFLFTGASLFLFTNPYNIYSGGGKFKETLPFAIGILVLCWQVILFLLLIQGKKKSYSPDHTLFLPIPVGAFLYWGGSCLIIPLIACMNGNYYPSVLMGIIALIWLNDTGAYFAGRSFGKHKLWELISPKKTWEGILGGTIASLLGAFIVHMLVPHLSTIHWSMISFIVSIAGPIGDLVESAFKRTAGVKDSGTILPGHGGVLDRFDSLIYVGPWVFLYLHFLHSL